MSLKEDKPCAHKGRHPSALYDGDINFRLWYLVKRNVDVREGSVWSPARWQNFFMLTIGFAFLFCFYVLPFLFWEDVQHNSNWVLAAVGLILAVLFLPILALTWTGLTHWPRLIIDRRRRLMIMRKGFFKNSDVVIRFDDIKRIDTEVVLDDAGGEVSGPFDVLYAELKDGQLVNIAAQSPKELLTQLRTLI